MVLNLGNNSSKSLLIFKIKKAEFSNKTCIQISTTPQQCCYIALWMYHSLLLHCHILCSMPYTRRAADASSVHRVDIFITKLVDRLLMMLQVMYTRGVHEKGDGGNSAKSAGFPRIWVWMLREYRGDWFFFGVDPAGMVDKFGCEKNSECIQYLDRPD